MLAAFAWGWRKGWSGGAIISGIAVGLSQYFYAGSRVGLILLGLFILKLWLDMGRSEQAVDLDAGERPGLRGSVRAWLKLNPERSALVVYTVKMGLMAACIAGPLLLYALRDPAPFFERSQAVWGWREETILMAVGEPGDVVSYGWRQFWRSVGAFTAVPDVTGFYGPGVPLLIGLAGPLFVIGLGWAAFKRRWLPVVWIFLTVFLGGFLLSDPPGSSHYVVAIPAICWLMAMPLDWLASLGRERLAVALMAAVVVVDIYFYFFVYVPGGPRDLIHVFPTL
jgi:hypothetical protein